jgi:tRNA(Leu) C34 or U34 (ribose-2'-O)-methylase TrmL
MVETRCPRPECGAIFEVEERWLGRALDCARCACAFTARPEALWRRLVRREAALVAGDVARAVPASEADARRQRRYLYHPAPEGDTRGAGLSRDFAYESSLDREAPAAPPIDLVAVLDDVRSQWNVGAVFRTADAAGLRALVLCGITPMPPARGVCKTALGAETMVPWAYRASVVEALSALSSQGREIVALEIAADAESVFDAPMSRRAALVIGNEVVGVSAEARRLCARSVMIPMSGRKGSLNVAVAFGVAAFALARAWRRDHGADEAED